MASTDKLRKKKVLKMTRSLQKEESEHKLDDISGSDNEDIDFSKEIRPIGYYINDREKMIEEMFSIIKNEKLKKMLPPVLKHYSLEEIKADCLVHLLGMSKKRIYATLQGRDLNSSSDSETDSTNSVLGSDSSEEPQITSSTHVKSDVEEIDDTLDISVSKNDLDSLMQDKRSQPNTSRKRNQKSLSQQKQAKKIKSERSPSLIEISDDEVVNKKKKKNEKRIKKKSEKRTKIKHKYTKEKSKKTKSESSGESSDEKDTNENGSVLVDSKRGKSLLEILELEMRARAIRALLEANPSAIESTSKIKQDPETVQNKSTEKIDTSADDEPAENVDESDSFDVEVINDTTNEDAIIILDDIDEQIVLEPDNDPESPEKSSETNHSNKNPPKSSESIDHHSEQETLKSDQSDKKTPNKYKSDKQTSKRVQSDKETSKSDQPSKKTSKHDSSDKETLKSDTSEKEIPTSDPTTISDESSDASLTWPQRWAESKAVKEIMQSSKLCANIRKRMRFARMLKQKQDAQQQQQQQQQLQNNEPENPLITELRRVEEGSIDQLQLLKLLEETKHKPVELTKKICESEKQVENDSENTKTIPSNDNEEDCEIDDGEPSNQQLMTSKDNNKASEYNANSDVVEKQISCHIDLTDG